MTSEIGVERIVEQQFLFHCSCGATIETSQKRETCPDCGATIEVIRCVPTPDGKKYTLRISKHRHRRSAEPFLWPLDLHPHPSPARHHQHHEEAINKQLFGAMAATPPTRRYHYTPNYERRYVDLGLLILLAPLWVPLLWLILTRVSTPVDQGRPSPQVVEMPKPTDCGWFSGCHYERQVIHLNDKHGKHTIVEWQRVND
jgi:predicted RNA-binding Zn-ribbon protein involved in translation (DUF1610 family)